MSINTAALSSPLSLHFISTIQSKYLIGATNEIHWPLDRYGIRAIYPMQPKD